MLQVGQPVPEAMVSADTPKTSKDLLSQTVPDEVIPGGVSVESGKRGPDERQGVEKLPIQVLLVAMYW